MGSADPFQFTLVLTSKPVPVTSSGKALPPAVAEDGDREVIVSCRCEMVNGSGAGEVWPGVTTPTEAVPEFAIRFAAMVAEICVDDANVVARAVPFQVICVACVKPDPEAVN